MPQHDTLIIMNPIADLGNAWRQSDDLRLIVDQYGGADWSGTVYPTHATELAVEACQKGYRRVISVGGDGTSHEIINGFMQFPADQRPALGIVPVGSGNDFAHNIGVPKEAPAAMRKALQGSPHPFDVSLIEDNHGRSEYWWNTLGIGFDANVAVRTRKLTRVRGFMLYLVATLQTIMMDHHYPLMTFQSDQENWQRETLMVTICNGAREGGGFHIAPDAKADDGILDYATVKKISRLGMLNLLPRVMAGTHTNMKPVHMGTFKEMTLQSESPMHIHFDGEIYAGFGSEVNRISIEIFPAAVKVLV